MATSADSMNGDTAANPITVFELLDYTLAPNPVDKGAALINYAQAYQQLLGNGAVNNLLEPVSVDRVAVNWENPYNPIEPYAIVDSIPESNLYGNIEELASIQSNNIARDVFITAQQALGIQNFAGAAHLLGRALTNQELETGTLERGSYDMAKFNMGTFRNQWNTQDMNVKVWKKNIHDQEVVVAQQQAQADAKQKQEQKEQAIQLIADTKRRRAAEKLVDAEEKKKRLQQRIKEKEVLSQGRHEERLQQERELAEKKSKQEEAKELVKRTREFSSRREVLTKQGDAFKKQADVALQQKQKDRAAVEKKIQKQKASPEKKLKELEVAYARIDTRYETILASLETSQKEHHVHYANLEKEYRDVPRPMELSADMGDVDAHMQQVSDYERELQRQVDELDRKAKSTPTDMESVEILRREIHQVDQERKEAAMELVEPPSQQKIGSELMRQAQTPVSIASPADQAIQATTIPQEMVAPVLATLPEALNPSDQMMELVRDNPDVTPQDSSNVTIQEEEKNEMDTATEQFAALSEAEQLQPNLVQSSDGIIAAATNLDPEQEGFIGAGQDVEMHIDPTTQELTTGNPLEEKVPEAPIMNLNMEQTGSIHEEPYGIQSQTMDLVREAHLSLAPSSESMIVLPQINNPQQEDVWASVLNRRPGDDIHALDRNSQVEYAVGWNANPNTETIQQDPYLTNEGEQVFDIRAPLLKGNVVGDPSSSIKYVRRSIALGNDQYLHTDTPVVTGNLNQTDKGFTSRMQQIEAPAPIPITQDNTPTRIPGVPLPTAVVTRRTPTHASVYDDYEEQRLRELQSRGTVLPRGYLRDEQKDTGRGLPHPLHGAALRRVQQGEWQAGNDRAYVESRRPVIDARPTLHGSGLSRLYDGTTQVHHGGGFTNGARTSQRIRRSPY